VPIWTCLDPLTSITLRLPIERANRRHRQVSRSRCGWKTTAGHWAMLAALQGFDTS
jgi:hypothetical protein